MLAARSSVGSDSSLSYPSHEPSLLDQLRAGLAQGKNARKILQSKRSHGDMTINFSLTSSPGSLNSTADISLPPERRRTNPLTRKKKNDITVNFTMNDSTSSQGSLNSTSNISLPPERRRATNPLVRKPKKDMKLNFTVNDTASSCENLENESPLLPTNQPKPLFKKPAARKPSIRFDDIFDSDTSKVHDDSLPTVDLQSQLNPLNPSVRSKAAPEQNMTLDISLGNSESSDKSVSTDSVNNSGPSSNIAQNQAPNHNDSLPKLEPDSRRRSPRSSVSNIARDINLSYDILQNDSGSTDKPVEIAPTNNSGTSSNNALNEAPSDDASSKLEPESRRRSLRSSVTNAARDMNVTYDVPRNDSASSDKQMDVASLNNSTLSSNNQNQTPEQIDHSNRPRSLRSSQSEAARDGNTTFDIASASFSGNKKSMAQVALNGSISSMANNIGKFSAIHPTATDMPCDQESYDTESSAPRAISDLQGTQVPYKTSETPLVKTRNNETGVDECDIPEETSPNFEINDTSSVAHIRRKKRSQPKKILVGPSDQSTSSKLDEELPELHHSGKLKRKKNNISVNFTFSDSTSNERNSTTPNFLGRKERPLLQKKSNKISIAFQPNDTVDTTVHETSHSTDQGGDCNEEQCGNAADSSGLVPLSSDCSPKNNPNASLSVILDIPTNPLKKHLRSNKISIPYKCDDTVDESTDTLPLPSGKSINPLTKKRSERNKISFKYNLEETVNDCVPSTSGSSDDGDVRNSDADENTINQSPRENASLHCENQEHLEELPATSNITKSSEALSLGCSMDDMRQSLLDHSSESVQCSQKNAAPHHETYNESKEIVSADGHAGFCVSRSSGKSSDDMQLELSLDESLRYSGMDSSASITNGDVIGGNLTDCPSKVDEAEVAIDRDQSRLLGATHDSSVHATNNCLVLRRSRRGSKSVTIGGDLSGSKDSPSDLSGLVEKLSKIPLNTRSRQQETSNALPDEATTSETDTEAFCRTPNNERTASTPKSRKSVSISPDPRQDDGEPIVQNYAGSAVASALLEVGELGTSAASRMPHTDQLPGKIGEKNESHLQSVSLDAEYPASSKCTFRQENEGIELLVVAPKEPHGLPEPNTDQLRSSLEPPVRSELCGIRKPSPCSTPALDGQELLVLDASPHSLPIGGLVHRSSIVSPVVSSEKETLYVHSAVLSPERPVGDDVINDGKPSNDVGTAPPSAETIQTTASGLHLHLTTFETEAGNASIMKSRCTVSSLSPEATVTVPLEQPAPRNEKPVQDVTAVGVTESKISQPPSDNTVENAKHLNNQAVSPVSELHQTLRQNAAFTNKPVSLGETPPTNVEPGIEGNDRHTALDNVNNCNAISDVDSLPSTSQAVRKTGTSLHLHLTTFDTESGDATDMPVPMLPPKVANPTTAEIGIEGNSKHAAHDNIKNSNANSNFGSLPSAAQTMQTANSLHLHLTTFDTEAVDATPAAPILPSQEAECIPLVAQVSKLVPAAPSSLNPIAGPSGIPDKVDPPKPIVPRKSKRKSVSFKPPTENLYHSPPDLISFQQLDQNAESRAQADNGYEFSRIQMTTDISEIQPSPSKKKAKRHFTSTPIPKPKKPVSDDMFALPEPVASAQPTDHQFVVPPIVPFTKRVSIQPIPNIITPLRHSEGEPGPVSSEGGSSSSVSDDVSCENSLDISAIPKDVTAPKWRKAPHFIHSTPLHRPKASLKRLKKKSYQPPAVTLVDDPNPENQGEAQVVNHSVQTSHNLRSRSKTSIESGSGSEPHSQSPSESRSLRRSARRNQTPVTADVLTSKSSSDGHAENEPVDGSPAHRIAIHENTILSTRIESQSRTRGSRTRSTTGSGFKSYDSHHKMTSRRLFNNNNENKSSTDPTGETDLSPPKSPSAPPASNDAASTSRQDDELMSPAETSIARSYEPSLPQTDENMSLIADQQPDDYSDNESVVSGVSTGSSSSVPSHVVMRQSFESQISSLRHRSHSHHRVRVEPERHRRAPEPPKLRSRFAIPRPPPSDLDSIYPVDVRVKKRKRCQTPRVKLFNPGPKWKKSKELYVWLKKKLQPICKLRTSLESELLVIELDRARVMVSQGHKDNALDLCLESLNRLKICTNQLELWGFFMKFMPFEFVREVVPMGGAFGKPFDVEQSFLPDDPV